MKNENNFNKLKSLVINGAIEGLKEAGEFVAEDAKIRAPIDTGRLRDSIRILEDNKVYIKIGTDVFYGYYQHETNPNGGAFYLINALINNEDEITSIVLNKIMNNLKTL